jgi:hypothetical protein
MPNVRKMTYQQARMLVLAGGVLLVGVLAAALYARRVENVEVAAVLLYVPVFIALLTWDAIGGAVGGVVAGGCYVALRWSAIQAVGFGQFGGLVTSRVLGFVVFGVLGGLANRQLRGALTKLVLYDQVDDATGLYNARFVVAETDLEVSRSKRYKTVFSVALVDIPLAWTAPLRPKRRARLLHAMGVLLNEGVRTIDRVAHSADGSAHHIAILLPETGGDGSRLFADRLATRLTEWLQGQGLTGDGPLRGRAVTYPGDDAGLAEVRAQFEALDRVEHPPARRHAALSA